MKAPKTLAPLFLIGGLAGGAFAAVTAGCSQGGDELNAHSGAPAADGPSDAGVEASPAPVAANGDQPVAPYLRRLTKFEYANTVSDLFPTVTTLDFDALVDDSREQGKFDNDVAEQGATETTVASFENAAEDVAAVVVAADPKIVACASGAAAQMGACASTYFDSLLPRVYRRPLTADERARVNGLYAPAKAEYDFPTAMRMTIAGVLLTPQFLFRAELVQGNENPAAVIALSPYEMASRLSYFFWGSLPDDELFAAAAANKLTLADDVEKEARRMLTAPRARLAVRDFHMQWLDLDQVAEITKDPTEYPGVTASLKASMVEESERFSEWNTFDGPGTLDSFLTTPQSFVDQNTAALYGVAPPAQMSLTQLNPAERAGILTQPSVQSVLAHDQIGSPILRGVFVMDRFLWRIPERAGGHSSRAFAQRGCGARDGDRTSDVREPDLGERMHGLPLADQSHRIRIPPLRRDGTMARYRSWIADRRDWTDCGDWQLRWRDRDGKVTID